MTTRFLTVIGLLALLCGCQEGGSSVPEEETLVTCTGTVTDPLLDDAPVGDAYVVMDTGDELIEVRTSPLGGFEIPDVPGDVPLALTVAAPDRRAVSRTDLVLDDEELPLEIGLTYREESYYDRTTLRFSGTLTGAPQGSMVYITGAGMSDYPYVMVEDDAPVPFQVQAELFEVEETYLLGALAMDPATGELLGGGALELDPTLEVELELAVEQGAPASVTVGGRQPVLNGVPLDTLDEQYVNSHGLVFLDSGRGPFMGMTFAGAVGEEGYELSVDHFPVDGYDSYLSLYLTPSLTQARDFTFTQVPLEAGADQLTVDPLDSPELVDDDVFAPGVTLGWAPVEGAERYNLYVMDGDVLAWSISTGATEATFPRFPDDFDTSMIFDEADLVVRAYRYDEDEDGELDTTRPWSISGTLAGPVSW